MDSIKSIRESNPELYEAYRYITGRLSLAHYHEVVKTDEEKLRNRRQVSKAYYEANKEKLIARSKEYMQSLDEETRERYRATHRESCRKWRMRKQAEAAAEAIKAGAAEARTGEADAGAGVGKEAGVCGCF